MNRKSIIILSLILAILVPSSLPFQSKTAHASEILSFVVLSEYTKTLAIGNEFYLIAITSNATLASFKSNNSKVASVDTYGKVTAKKSGTATITAKIKNAEASCKVYVDKTQINLNIESVSIERNETCSLLASTSNGSNITYKSNKKSVACIDENGCILGLKPGEAVITVSADDSTKTCKVIVKEPTIKFDKTSLTLYRGETFKLSAVVSSNVSPTWKSNRSRVALVDNSGTITAIKHGTAIITAKVDGTIKICEVMVKSPTIQLNKYELSLKKDATFQLNATVSSGNKAVFTSSNSSVVSIDEAGTITALGSGSAYITASEDGTKVKCKVTVIK